MLVFIIESKESPHRFRSPGILEVWPCESFKIDHVMESLRFYCSIREALTHKEIDMRHYQLYIVGPKDIPRLLVIVHGHMDGWMANRKRN
jgi:hypothetical protein